MDGETRDMVVTWRRLLRWAAISAVVELALVTIAAKLVIPPVVVIALLFAVAAWLLGRPGKAGVIVALIALLVFTTTNFVFALPDLSEWRSFPSFWVSAASFVTAVVGLIAVVMVLRGRDVSSAARAIALGSAAAVLGLVAVNALASFTYDEPARGSNDVTIAAKDIKWTTNTLSVPAGQVSFYADNRDGILHNFHIRNVGTVSMPASHAVRKAFDLKPGTYTYVCDFHVEDMKGELTVT